MKGSQAGAGPAAGTPAGRPRGPASTPAERAEKAIEQAEAALRHLAMIRGLTNDQIDAAGQRLLQQVDQQLSALRSVNSQPFRFQPPAQEAPAAAPPEPPAS